MSETKGTRRQIAVLPPEIASQIAAGEVIERPASAVKELVENSLDAGASQIEILMEDGGKQLIQVTDDGVGMTPDEAMLAIQRHATSKISSAEDLFRVASYGFRGEAIPSIASVSEFELVTKTADAGEAFRILIRGGKVVEQGSAAGRTGTSIRVSRLFENVPARLKFLKASSTELSRGLEFVQRLALAHPEVAFTVRHGKQENFTHAGGDAVGALVSVFGRHVAREMIPVSVDSWLRVRAWLAPPAQTRNNRQQMMFFVNGRPIASRTISHAVDEAYSGLLPHGRFPIAVVMLEVPPDLVDVNVHPRKAEVKFLREHDVHSAVFHSLRDSLVAKGLVPRLSPGPSGPFTFPEAQQPGMAFNFSPPSMGTSGAFSFVPAPEFRADPETNVNGQGAPAQPLPEPRPDSTHLADQRINVNEIRVLGQIANTYIVLETREGMAIIDQHVAHERVLYERFRQRANETSVQLLAVPITLEMTRREALVVMERLKEFQALGFQLEPFGPDTVLLRGVPAGLRMDRLEATLRDMVSEVVELTVEKKMLAPREAVVTSAACKAAVKAGDRMSEPEIRSLLEQLMQCDNPYVCPHGRPIIVRLDTMSLEKIFQR